MRAPLCPDSSPEEQGNGVSDNKCKSDEIHAVKKSSEKKHSSKTGVFGICLDILMGSSSHIVTPPVPFVLSRLCEYIESHGLCHKNLFVETGEKNLVENLKVEFIESGDAPLEAVGSVSSASRLLITFLEELPEPLIPIKMQPLFLKDMENLTLNSLDIGRHLQRSVAMLPDCTFNVLKFLSGFLLKVVQNQEHNGVNYDRLGQIFGPVMFRTFQKDSLLVVEKIAKCFVRSYHDIFESDAALSSEAAMKSCSKPHQNSADVKSRIQLPCPSSVMPLMPLEPLSVVIPSVDSRFETTEKCGEGLKHMPMLLIEKQMDRVGDVNKTNVLCVEDSSTSKEKNTVCSTRKRKERRLSGEESGQVQRSSSEERPSPTTAVSHEKTELMRRCSSHEDMNEAIKSDGGSKDWVEKSQPVDSYFADSLEQVLNEKDHSPHPPNAKRREVESSSSKKMDIAVSQENQFSSTSDHVLQSWKETTKMDRQHKPTPEKSLNLDVKCQYTSKQNSLPELELESIMDCSASKGTDEPDEDSNPITPDSGEFCDSKKAKFPRSASCPISRTENENNSDSDSNSLSMSWSMLFESEDSEPVRSEQRLHWPNSKYEDDTLLSPSVQSLRRSSFYEAPLSPSAYRSYLSYRHTHLDPSVPPSPPVEQEDFAKSVEGGTSTSDSIKQYTKKIHGLKKKIKRFDEKFESEFGYKPSHAEKSNNPDAKKLMSDLHKARKELKVLKEESHLEHVAPSAIWHPHRESHILGDSTNCLHNDVHKDKARPSVEDSLGETLKSLAEERRTAKRPDCVDDMTKEQVKEEKLCIQKALLNFESIHGKPCTKEERNTIRPLYDRYRCVKRLLVRSGTFPGAGAKNKDLCSELQPILEHETMDFISPQHRTNAELPEAPEINMDNAVASVEEPPSATIPAIIATEEKPEISHSLQFLTSKYNNSNIHELPLSEMIFQMQQCKSEKRRLRKILREFETEFQRLNGRKVQKEDKAPVEALYAEYKHVKARLKLLEALISKHDQHQLM